MVDPSPSTISKQAEFFSNGRNRVLHMYNSIVLGHRRSGFKYSAERLDFLYAELLRCIDVTSADLTPRQASEESKALSWRMLILRKKSLPDSKDHDKLEESDRRIQRKRNLAAAFRTMVATRGNEDGATLDYETSKEAMATARDLEKYAVFLIRTIGEVVVNGHKTAFKSTSNSSSKTRNCTKLPRGDDAFEYFCERKILFLLVDIAKDKPRNNTSTSWFHGVVWTPQVKAQVFQTISLLVSSIRDPSALYYILSQHCVNTLVESVQPLNQWTDSALQVMLEPYLDLLKNLSLQLGAAPNLFPFLCVEKIDGNGDSTAHFPLFSAILMTATSTYAQSDSFVHVSCLNLLVGLLQIEDISIQQQWKSLNAMKEHRCLSNHLCDILLKKVDQFVKLTTGPVVDAVRSNALQGQISALDHQIEFLNDIFWCEIQNLNVLLCETLLQRVISVLLNNLVTSHSRNFLVVGVDDVDVIPELEAMAQVSAFVLSRLMAVLEYAPLVRMLAVALFHPQSVSDLWDQKTEKQVCSEKREAYRITRTLGEIATKAKAVDTIPNPYRLESMMSLQGAYGIWRAISASLLVETTLRSEYLDRDILAKVKMLPAKLQDPSKCPYSITPTRIEEALKQFLSEDHPYGSGAFVMAYECISSLALRYLSTSIMIITEGGKQINGLDEFLRNSCVLKTLRSTKADFFRLTLESQGVPGVSKLFVDLVESAVQERYTRITVAPQSNNVHRAVTASTPSPIIFTSFLSQYDGSTHHTRADVLVRGTRTVVSNEVESARLCIRFSLHFRSLCRILDRFVEVTKQQAVASKSPREQRIGLKEPRIILADNADDLSQVFCCLRTKPSVGADFDLRGRKGFRFSPITDNVVTQGDGIRSRTLSEDLIVRSETDLTLILDPTFLLVVKPLSRSDYCRGTVICCVSLLDVIAAAMDGEWLHIAVRHDDVFCLIKNGNMALSFESGRTCFIVQQYLDRCRKMLRMDLLEQIKNLFTEEQSLAELSSNSFSTSLGRKLVESRDIPHVKTI